MKSLILALKSAPVVYITRDLERALGGLHLNNYFIITNGSAFAKHLASKNKNIRLINEENKLDTVDLINHAETARFLSTLANPRVLVFKNTTLIERACAAKGWTLLNPSATLASKVEEKISQLTWLGDLEKYLPPHQVKLGKEIRWSGKKYIVQFNRAHTGGGTYLITSEQDVAALQKKFPNRQLRVTDFIDGPAFTNNNVVWNNQILTGNISYQITGLSPFTDNLFATIGNDWGLPQTLLSKKQIVLFKEMATAIGEKLASAGWKGLFGIDTILDQTTGQLYLLEINARQPASTSYESTLQKKSPTTFEAHLAGLLNLPTETKELTAVMDGAQIIQRITNATTKVTPTALIALEKIGAVTPYENTEPGSDLLRIQLQKSIMDKHQELNELGQKVQNLLEKN